MFRSAASFRAMIPLLIPVCNLLNNAFHCLKAPSLSLRHKQQPGDTSKELEKEISKVNSKGRDIFLP